MPRRRMDRGGHLDRRDIRRREAAERWRTRGQIVSELRNVVALVREIAEVLIAVAKASLLWLLIFAGPAATVLLVCELLRSR